MLELREASKGRIRGYYHGEELEITSIKYTRVVRTIVEETLPSKPSSEVKSVMGSNEETKDSEQQPLSDSVSNELEVYRKTSGIPVYPKRKYSTHTRSHVRSSDSVTLVPYESSRLDLVPYESRRLDLVPRKINLLRDVKGSFYLD